MTESISRKLFQHLLFLYPKLFRDEFGKEMLDVFEDCRRSESSWSLLADGLVSAVKQQIFYHSILPRKGAAVYAEVGLSLSSARMMAGAAVSLSLIAGVLAPAKRDDFQTSPMAQPEALFWFPIVPEARSCSGIAGYHSEPARIFTTGAWVRGTAESRQYCTIVGGKTGLWISTLSWGSYCLDTSANGVRESLPHARGSAIAYVQQPSSVVANSAIVATFNQWLDAFNSGDESKISGFWQKYGSNQLPANRFALDVRLRKATGGMEIFRITEETQTHLAVLMKERRGLYSESIMDLTSAAPPVVGRLIGRPVPPPDNYPSQALDDADLITKVREHIDKVSGTGAFSGAVLIAHQGKVLLNQAWGDADTARNLPNTPDTQFMIASMNKMFTAVAVLQLVTQGKLALDVPIAAYWPDYPNHDLAARVTVRELLDHTAGTGDIFVPEVDAHRAELHTLADVVQLLGNRPVEFPPGTQWRYSNYGFILLGRLIELVSGEPYDKYVREHVFLPAGMLHTTPRPETNRAGNYAIGYTHGSDGLTPTTPARPEPPVAGGTAAGGGYSTVHDLFLFAQALQSRKLLSAALLKQATSWDVVHPQCGLGFSLAWNGAYGHAGAGPGANGELRILPQRGYVLIALANRDPQIAGDILDAITFMLPHA